MMNRLNQIAFLKANRGLKLQTNREKMYWFFREQFRFGHREVLLDYLGRDYSNLIWGFLQHGAHPHPNIGYWPYQELPKNLTEFHSSFVWSENAALLAKSRGHNHVTAIGAPWLYLLSKKGLLADNNTVVRPPFSPTRELLIVPAHGSGHYFANSNYSEVVSKLRRKIGDIDASVLLYYTEFCDPQIRQIWINAGFNLECSGMAWGAEHRTVWTYNGGRPKFLANTLDLISNHKEVICLSPTTLAIYSCSIGIPTSIQLNPESRHPLGVVSEGKGVARLRKYDEEILNHSSNLLGNNFAERDISTEKINRSLQYLGIESIKTRNELENVLPLIEGMIPVPLNSN